MEGLKVIAAEEMVRVEKLAIQQGCSEEKFMQTAGEKVAVAAKRLAEKRKLKEILLLIGKGNKGGDAFVAGIDLLQAGYKVSALTLYDPKECSPLNQKWGALFWEKGGKAGRIKGKQLIIDGLLGTGFKGSLDLKTASIVEEANASKCPILAIDIPTGLNGTTGAACNLSIQATQTVTLGLPKIGLFLRDGWNASGELFVENFGLPEKIIEQAKPLAYLPKWEDLQLPKIIRNRHKYQAGYVVGLAGSAKYPGAAKLAGLAALRAGAGIVRVFHKEDIGSTPMELIAEKWSAASWKKELARAKSLFIGPGIGSIKGWEKTIRHPCVIDADALNSKTRFPEQAILTPHRGEVLTLLGLKTTPPDEELFAKIIRFCERKKVFVILKGAPSFIFAPEKMPLIIPRGDPGMATAGSGDVLTGVLAALLAQGMEPYQAAILGTLLHAIAGEKAADAKTSYSMIAGDIIEHLGDAFKSLPEM